LQRLKDIIHRSDPTRLITAACDQIAAEPKSALPEFLEKLDVVGYNYVDRWRDRREKFYSIDRRAFPERRFVGTETSALYGARGVYAADARMERFFGHASNTEIEVEQLQKFIQTYDYVSGDFIWTGIDYIGESFWPSKLAPTGPLDTCGFKKDNFYFYQSLWTDKPVLHLSPHWNWPGKESQIVSVTCFTNCDTVELFLNGKSLGVKGYAFPRPGMTKTYGHYPPRARTLQTTADLHLAWDVPYAPGTLRAEGTKDGKVIRTVEVHTTGPASKLELIADRPRIRIVPGDIAHITVRVLDEQGLVVPTADNPIAFDLQGEGRILGVDNGRPDSHESYKTSSRDAFNGLALVLLQSTGRPGAMTLSAHSPSLASATVQVTAS
jgi:beta-galactosidase